MIAVNASGAAIRGAAGDVLERVQPGLHEEAAHRALPDPRRLHLAARDGRRRSRGQRAVARQGRDASRSDRSPTRSWTSTSRAWGPRRCESRPSLRAEIGGRTVPVRPRIEMNGGRRPQPRFPTTCRAGLGLDRVGGRHDRPGRAGSARHAEAQRGRNPRGRGQHQAADQPGVAGRDPDAGQRVLEHGASHHRRPAGGGERLKFLGIVGSRGSTLDRCTDVQ